VYPLCKRSSVPLARGCDPARDRPYETRLQDRGLILQPDPVTVGEAEVAVLTGMAGRVRVLGLRRVNAAGRLDDGGDERYAKRRRVDEDQHHHQQDGKTGT
jgi:hypothetical protein